MPVFVVTHSAHEPEIRGETTFTFVSDGITRAIAQAAATAGDKKVHIMGGASIIQQALNAKLVDPLQLHVTPVLLGDGTPLFAHLDGPIPLEQIEVIATHNAHHLRYRVVTWRALASHSPSTASSLVRRSTPATSVPCGNRPPTQSARRSAWVGRHLPTSKGGSQQTGSHAALTVWLPGMQQPLNDQLRPQQLPDRCQ
jgi:RibD C-terminal domain